MIYVLIQKCEDSNCNGWLKVKNDRDEVNILLQGKIVPMASRHPLITIGKPDCLDQSLVNQIWSKPTLPPAHSSP